MEEKKKRVKDRIVSAAWELFYEKGYDATTVDDIIRLSDTSKGSFYYYFDGKDALLNTLSTDLTCLWSGVSRLICWRPCILPSSSRRSEKSSGSESGVL